MKTVKNILFIFSVLFSLSLQIFAENLPEQTAWSRPNVRGYSFDSKTNKIDDTESLGALDSISTIFGKNAFGLWVFENGGGGHDDNRNHLKNKFGANALVYDRFMRPSEHNKQVIETALKKSVDSCTSMSVLNVIDTRESRLAHIKLCYDVLTESGVAYFKVWPGDESKIPQTMEGGYQSNQNANFYLDEVKEIFGNDNVILHDEKTIKATKKTVEGEKKLVASCSSMSPINFIASPDDQLHHIRRCYEALKEDGFAYFKIASDNSDVQEQDIAHAMSSVKNVFGADNVVLQDAITIRAVKKKS